MMIDLPFHPAAEIFPLHQGEIDALAKNIKERRLKVPILTYQGMILDGRRRYLACKQAGVEPEFEEWRPQGDESPTELVASLNLHRRQLTINEKVQVALKIVESLKAEAKERQVRSQAKPGQKIGTAKVVIPGSPPLKPEESGKLRDKAAELAGVSTATVQRAIKVQTSGTPELKQAMATGSMPVRTAAEIAKLPAQEQLRALEDERAELATWAADDERQGHLTKAKKALARAAKALEAAGEEVMAGDVEEIIARVDAELND